MGAAAAIVDIRDDELLIEPRARGTLPEEEEEEEEQAAAVSTLKAVGQDATACLPRRGAEAGLSAAKFCCPPLPAAGALRAFRQDDCIFVMCICFERAVDPRL